MVLERATRVGGLAGSFEVAGQRVDYGSHRLHPSAAPFVLTAVDRLLGGDLQRRTRNGRMRLAGRFVAFPPRVPELVRRLPPRLSLALRARRDRAPAPE